MPLSCVLSVGHVVQHTGDWAVPTPGTRLDMTLRRGSKCQKDISVVAGAH